MASQRKSKEQEFAAVVSEQHAGLRYFIRSLGVRMDWVDDLAQEAFLVAYRKWNELDSPQNAGYWLRSIARNLVMNEISKTTRRQRLLDENLTTLLLNAEDHSPVAGALSDSEVRHDALRDCMQELSVRTGKVVFERYFNDLNSTQIAEKLSMTSTAVRKVLFNARKSLALCLLKHSVTRPS